MKRKLIILVALAALAACSKEKGPGVEVTEREVEMNFLLPGAATRAGSQDQDAIRNLTVLVFDGKGDDAKYLYSRYAWRKGSGGNTFTTTLKTGSGFTICFAANVSTLPDGLENAGIVENQSTWSQVRQALILRNQVSDVPSNGLPMWGRVTDQTIAVKEDTHLGTVQLVRSVAAIDVIMLADNFTLEAGYTVFAADMGYLPYDPEKMDLVSGILRANAPYSPPGFNTLVDLRYDVPAGGNEIMGEFFVYDNSTSLTSPSGDNRPTKVVLKGIWEDGEGRSTYYPLTIRDRVAADTYVKKRVTRNNKYTIMVTNVNGDGYDDLDEAKESDDVNWDYDVIEWDDNQDGEITIDGPKYFFRDRSAVTLPRSAGSATRVNIRTNYGLDEIKMKFAEQSVYTEGGLLDSHPRFKIEIVEGSSVGSSYDMIRITAKQDYGPDNNPATLSVAVGRITFNIRIEQVGLSPEDWQDGGGIAVDLG